MGQDLLDTQSIRSIVQPIEQKIDATAKFRIPQTGSDELDLALRLGAEASPQSAWIEVDDPSTTDRDISRMAIMRFARIDGDDITRARFHQPSALHERWAPARTTPIPCSSWVCRGKL